MRRQGGVNFLLSKIESLQYQNSQLRKQIRQRENFNRKLCSENRKRRLKNNQLMSLENNRLLQLKNIRGHQQQYRNMAINLRSALKSSQEKLQQYEDEILILKTEITKQKKESQKYQDQIKLIKKQLDKKTEEFQRFMILQNEVAKKRIQTKKPLDEEEQIFTLVCQNQQLQMKLKDYQKAVNSLRHQLDSSLDKIKQLENEIQNSQQIIKILRLQFEEQVKQITNKNSTKSTPNQLTKTIINPHSHFQVSTKIAPSKVLQQYGIKLNKRQQNYFSQIQHLLYSQNLLQNLTFNPITVHYCKQLNLNQNLIWYTKIRLTSQGQINFGLSNNPANIVQVMGVRNYIYYNNCSGLIVIDQQGKIIDEYSTVNDTLTIAVNLMQRPIKIKLYRNDALIYECPLPQQLSKGQYIYPYVRLFQFMSIEMQ